MICSVHEDSANVSVVEIVGAVSGIGQLGFQEGDLLLLDALCLSSHVLVEGELLKHFLLILDLALELLDLKFDLIKFLLELDLSLA